MKNLPILVVDDRTQCNISFSSLLHRSYICCWTTAIAFALASVSLQLARVQLIVGLNL